MKLLEQVKTEHEKVQREIKHLENRQKILLNKKADAERKARTHRLIERGAILENVFPSVIHLSNEEVNKRLSMWKQYADNKPVHQQLASLKSRACEKFQDAHSVELALYDASVRYLDELKASGEKITPKRWQAETERLSANNDTLYQQMKAMRTDIQTVEKIRKTADELAQSEKSRDWERDYER